MQKIFFNLDGWVCERYPNDIPIDNPNRYIEVDDDTYNKTLSSTAGNAWRVINNKLVEEVYNKKEFQASAMEEERAKLKEEIIKVKEDVEQVELFGMERSDYVQKKARCVEIIERLRVLEQRLKELSKEGK